MNILWMITFYLFSAIWMQPIGASLKDESLHYGVTSGEDTFATIFDMSNEKTHYGSVVKSMFHLAPNYDSYDRYGLYQASGICRMMTLGLFYSWASEIDIYDGHGDKIGTINGHILCTEPAKFSFYDVYEKRVCIAYLDRDCKCFVIVDADDASCVLARLTRNFSPDTDIMWDVSLYYPERLPLKFLNIFAAFVCDTENYFGLEL